MHRPALSPDTSVAMLAAPVGKRRSWISILLAMMVESLILSPSSREVVCFLFYFY